MDDELTRALALPSRRSLLSLDHLTDDDLWSIVDRGVQHSAPGSVVGAPLAGKVIGTLFRHTSTRTRSSFTVAAMRLGASVISYGPDDLQLKTGETVADTGECSPACSTPSSPAPPAIRPSWRSWRRAVCRWSTPCLPTSTRPRRWPI